jgi:hypothetical protein
MARKKQPENTIAALIARVKRDLEAEAANGWQVAEGCVDLDAAIREKVGVEPTNPQFRDRMKAATGYNNFREFWPAEVGLVHRTVQLYLQAFRLRTIVNPPEHIRLASPIPLIMSLKGAVGQDEQVAVIREAIANAPQNGIVGQTRIAQAVKARKQANPPPPKDWYERLDAWIGPADTQRKAMTKLCNELASQPDLEAIRGVIDALAGILEWYGPLMAEMRELSQRVDPAFAAKKGKRKPEPEMASA